MKERFQEYTGKDLQTFRCELLSYMDVLEMNIGRRALHESECLVKAREGITLDVGLESEASTYDNTSTEQQDGSSSSRHTIDAERARGDKVVFDVENVIIGPLLDNNTLMEVHHSNNGTFENMFALEIQHHGQHKVDNYSKANHEAQQATALLTKELERYKEKEKHFTKETTNESEYCKKD
ncbi:hypothetical protein Tco_1027913 [Tanacetum coccineum]